MEETLGEKIMRLRQAHRLSQETFGEKLGVSRQAVSKWETGQSTPDIDKIILMSELFEVTTDYLLKGGEAAPQTNPPRPAETVEAPADSSTDREESDAVSSALQLFVEKWRRISQRIEYKSKRTVGGLPLLHIKAGHAKGVFAVGLRATGICSVGLLSVGVVSIGVLSLGLLSIGSLALGGLSIGAIGAGILAIAGVAFGIFTIGGIAVGVYALGGCAIASKIAVGGYAHGLVAVGGRASGPHAFTVNGSIPDSMKSEIYRTICRELPHTPRWIVNLFR